ncbi:MAG: response regulator [Gammaproteobacteria bacterium]|nr:response regulator [Gammaproteobacteria bacterium]
MKNTVGLNMNYAKRKSILIIDDGPENIQIMYGLLSSTYDVQAAMNCADAFAIIYSDYCPDLILLDIVMPQMDGYEVIQRLKDDERSTNIPVMFLTAKNCGLDEELGYKLGAVDYITKPINPEFVLQRIETLLKLHYYHSYTPEPVESIDIPAVTEAAET